MKHDEIFEAEIVNLVEFGAFANINWGGKVLKGLIHISEISSKYVHNIGDFLKIGDKVSVVVISRDEEKNQTKLSMKRVPSEVEQEGATIA